jgi:hypothetical protein
MSSDMRRFTLLLGIVVAGVAIGSLTAKASGTCREDHPSREDDDPKWCRYCPPPEPDCALVACDRCGCEYWCPPPAVTAR